MAESVLSASSHLVLNESKLGVYCYISSLCGFICKVLNRTISLLSSGCTWSRVTSWSVSQEMNSSWTAPLSPSPASRSSSPCAPASTPTLRGATSSAVGTWWRRWKKTTSEQSLMSTWKNNHVERLISFSICLQAAGIPPSNEELLLAGSWRHNVWLLHSHLWQGAGEGKLAAALVSQCAAAGSSWTAQPGGQ